MKKKESIDNSSDNIHNDDDFVLEDEDIIPKNAIKELKKELAGCKKERQEFLEGWQRCKAEFINARKRNVEDLEESTDRAREELIAELIPVVENFTIAVGTIDTSENPDIQWVTGVKHIYDQLVSILKQSYGVEIINPIGKQFDPQEHDSIETEESDAETEDGVITKVLQIGFRTERKVLQAAKVRVAQKVIKG